MAIAGHTFRLGVCECGIYWADIRDVDSTFLNKEGVAHTGTLRESELAEIKAEREREIQQIANVMGWR